MFSPKKGGLFVKQRIPYSSILRLETKEEKLEYSTRIFRDSDLLYHGEKLTIITRQHKVVVRSIWLGDYLTFRNKLSHLAINARLYSPSAFRESKSYFVLVIGGIFILIMSYVNLFK
ncbi:hypothetical protein PK28_08410 [Hymenobacter sp. DG25B]|nr:hypothetical protein PK28_08410 [Hymenobacter sp. DG25B]